MEVYNTLLPLFKMVGSRPLVIIMPYHRWVQNPCCSNKSHTTNGGTHPWIEQLIVRIEDAGQNLRSFLFNKGFRNSVVINPQRSIEELPKQEIWELSNTIPSMKFLSKLGTKLIVNNSSMSTKRRLNVDPPEDNTKRNRGSQPGTAHSGGQGGHQAPVRAATGDPRLIPGLNSRGHNQHPRGRLGHGGHRGRGRRGYPRYY